MIRSLKYWQPVPPQATHQDLALGVTLKMEGFVKTNTGEIRSAEAYKMECY